MMTLGLPGSLPHCLSQLLSPNEAQISNDLLQAPANFFQQAKAAAVLLPAAAADSPALDDAVKSYVVVDHNCY